MANDLTCQVRRAAIAAYIANPYEATPSKQAMATEFGVDVRTIYRDIESAEVQETVQAVILSYAKSEGLSAAYKVVLAAIAGQAGFSKKEQLRAAMWLLEQIKLFDGTKSDDELQNNVDKIRDLINQDDTPE